MNSSDFVGRVAARFLQDSIESQTRNDDVEGTARFILDRLSAEQTASTARAVLNDTNLANQIEIKLPQHFMAGSDLPEEVLTDKRATYFRNAICEKSVLLLANIGDDEQQSLKELMPIGAAELLDRPDIWVEIAAGGLGLSDDHRVWWSRALTGLRDLRMLSLERFADYALRTRSEIEDEGKPIILALGAALPALRIPRNTTYFNGLNDKTRNYASKWKSLYEGADKKLACYLQKLTPTQIALNEADLAETFSRVKDDIPEDIHPVIQSYIVSPSGWNEAAAALAEEEWERLAPLFDGFRRERFNLGDATIRFYDEREPELINADENEYLMLLVSRKTSSAYSDDDLDFYNRHRNELKEDRKLKSAWDKFVFGTPLETEDFLSGIVLSCERLFSKDRISRSKKLRIRSDRTTKRELRDLNATAGLYFAHRYRGIKEVLGNRIAWDVGQLLKFDKLVEEWKESRVKLNDSSSRAALQIKFVLELEVEFEEGESQRYTTQMLWKFNPQSVTGELAKDWLRLSSHPLVRCIAHREQLGSKGQFQTVDLSDVKTFVPAYGKDRGSFVPVYRRENDIALLWLANLKTARDSATVNPETAQRIRESFEEFRDAYTSAISEFLEGGLSHQSLIDQVQAYSRLLSLLCESAKGDRNRELLLRPLLQIGTVEVIGGRPAAVVAPWHPLRLAGIVMKSQIVARLLRTLLTTPDVDFGDPRLFFGDLRDELSHPFYPELVLGWNNDDPELLALSDSIADYSLHEIPVTSNTGSEDTNENPSEAAALVVDLVHRYLELHPHELANLSIVLYNCDSARLPQAVVNKIGALHTGEDEVRCQVILRHRDGRRLRSLYEKLIEETDADADSFNASEATRDFMARLRIGIMADEAPPPSEKDGLPIDLVFSQDVIARNARVEWYLEDATPIDLNLWIPPRWSRRKPAASDDLKSMVYLCCPTQSEEGWSHLTAISTFIKGDWDGDRIRRYIPVRQLSFRDNTTANIFNETHRLANWVINYDELLDRRQLLNQGVRVIRYKQTDTQGRNLIISSDAPLNLLRSMVLTRLKDLNLDLTDEEYQALSLKFINDAKDLSGDIVLRAAKRGRNASELIGIVLSRYLVHRELGMDGLYGWYFLDDYANWLGQKEEQIADMMVLHPQTTAEGERRLAVVVTESKYITASSLAVKRKESQKQLRDTIRRIDEAVFGNPERMDRELWLSRLSNLLVDGIQFPSGSDIDLPSWRRAIRDGDCEIFLRGYSHVFISGPSDSGDLSDFSEVAGEANSYQEIFSRVQLRELVMMYKDSEDPMRVRRLLGGEDHGNTLTAKNFKAPSGPTEAQKRKTPTRRPTSTHTEVDGHINQDDTMDPENVGEPVVQVGTAGSLEQPILTEIDRAAPEKDPSPDAVGFNPWSAPQVQSLLDSSTTTAEVREDDTGWMKQLESKMRAALQQFQLQAKLERSVLTPNSALLKYVGSSNLTVDQVLKRRSEFLTTYGINVISVLPEPGIVSIAVERPVRQVVLLPDVWKRWRPESMNGNQSILIGVRESDGEPLFLSPGKEHAPHTLIAGSTGSGKSVLIQNILLGIAATNSPQQSRIVLIDPKQGVDYFELEGLPHLDGGVIDDQEDALQKLSGLVREMDNRYAKFKTARANNLASFNEKVGEGNALPAIWLFHDEFAEWMMVEEYRNEVTSLVGRLGVKARAAGIYLVFAAQRPDANVMPMQLRANLGNRLILRVDSEGTSEIALGDRGAERLLGRGHLLAKLEGSPLQFAQVPFIEQGFMANLVKALET